MLSVTEYATLRKLHDTHETARAEKFPRTCAFTPEMLAQLPPAPTNDQRSAIEEYEWRNDPPTRYFAYVDATERTITTWMGDVLGACTLGPIYRSNVGDKRQSIRVKGTNGRQYHGTFYVGAGDYCRLKASK